MDTLMNFNDYCNNAFEPLSPLPKKLCRPLVNPADPAWRIPRSVKGWSHDAALHTVMLILPHHGKTQAKNKNY